MIWEKNLGENRRPFWLTLPEAILLFLHLNKGRTIPQTGARYLPPERIYIRTVIKATGFDMASVTREVAVLSELGLVEKEHSGRRVYLSLTKDGEEVSDALYGFRKAVLNWRMKQEDLKAKSGNNASCHTSLTTNSLRQSESCQSTPKTSSGPPSTGPTKPMGKKAPLR